MQEEEEEYGYLVIISITFEEALSEMAAPNLNNYASRKTSDLW